MQRSRLNTLTPWLRSWANCGAHPGLACGVWKNGEEVYYGQENHKGSSMISRDAVYRIYSMTKPVTIVGILIMVERGLIAVNDPVEKFIPEFASPKVCTGGTADAPTVIPANRSITIKDLMMHTSGITYGIFGNNISDQFMRKNCPDAAHWFHNTSLKDLIALTAKTPLLFHPGTKWHYGLNTDVLGYILEVVSGLSLADFFHKEIFAPLGMDSTSFFVGTEEEAEHVAAGAGAGDSNVRINVPRADKLVQCYVVAPGQQFVDVSHQEERSRDIKGRGKVLLSGGGGLVSTMSDYGKFGNMLLHFGEYPARDGSGGRKRLLQKASVREMSANHLPNNGELADFAFENTFSESIGAGVGFGYGVSVIVRPNVARGAEFSGMGEYGWGGAASTFFSVDPEKGLLTILMTQLIPSSAFPLRTQFRYLAHWACCADNEDNTAGSSAGAGGLQTTPGGSALRVHFPNQDSEVATIIPAADVEEGTSSAAGQGLEEAEQSLSWIHKNHNNKVRELESRIVELEKELSGLYSSRPAQGAADGNA